MEGGGVKIIHPRRVVVEVKSDLPKILYILNGLFLSIFEWIFFFSILRTSLLDFCCDRLYVFLCKTKFSNYLFFTFVN